jgi:hypothetical protein
MAQTHKGKGEEEQQVVGPKHRVQQATQQAVPRAGLPSEEFDGVVGLGR